MIVIDLLHSDDKPNDLVEACATLRTGATSSAVYSALDASSFRKIPTCPLAYWIKPEAISVFEKFPAFGSDGRSIKQGIATADDFRFVRCWWEVSDKSAGWIPFAKGGSFARFHSEFHLKVNWKLGGKEIANLFDRETGKLLSRPQNIAFFGMPGLTWSDRTTRDFSARVWPSGGGFSVKGSAGFFGVLNLAVLAIMNTKVFNQFLALLVGAGDAAARSYQVGTIGQVPFPFAALPDTEVDLLASLAKNAWVLQKQRYKGQETSLCFLYPSVGRKTDEQIERETTNILSRIEDIALGAYGLGRESLSRATQRNEDRAVNCEDVPDEEDGENDNEVVPPEFASNSWGIGVAFGRFDILLATGEHTVPSEPDPFDPLPPKSPGMLPDEDLPFHPNSGILVDDAGHPHDLPNLIDTVLDRTNMDITLDTRAWLRRDFFPLSLIPSFL